MFKKVNITAYLFETRRSMEQNTSIGKHFVRTYDSKEKLVEE